MPMGRTAVKGRLKPKGLDRRIPSEKADPRRGFPPVKYNGLCNIKAKGIKYRAETLIRA